MLIKDQNRDKLDLKPQKFYFLGYGENEYNYRLWDGEMKIYMFRNILFNEDKLYKDRKDQKDQKVQKKPNVIDAHLNALEKLGSDISQGLSSPTSSLESSQED